MDINDFLNVNSGTDYDNLNSDIESLNNGFIGESRNGGASGGTNDNMNTNVNTSESVHSHTRSIINSNIVDDNRTVKVKEGIFIFNKEPKYIVDMLNDKLLVFYQISPESLKYYYEKRDNDNKADLSILRKIEVRKEVKYHFKHRFTNSVVNQAIKNSKYIQDKLKPQVRTFAKKHLFETPITMGKDVVTGNYGRVFEMKDNGTDNHTGVYLSMSHIYFLSEKIDLSKWQGYNNFLYFNFMNKQSSNQLQGKYSVQEVNINDDNSHSQSDKGRGINSPKVTTVYDDYGDEIKIDENTGLRL